MSSLCLFGWGGVIVSVIDICFLHVCHSVLICVRLAAFCFVLLSLSLFLSVYVRLSVRAVIVSLCVCPLVLASFGLPVRLSVGLSVRLPVGHAVGPCPLLLLPFPPACYWPKDRLKPWSKLGTVSHAVAVVVTMT